MRPMSWPEGVCSRCHRDAIPVVSNLMFSYVWISEDDDGIRGVLESWEGVHVKGGVEEGLAQPQMGGWVDPSWGEGGGGGGGVTDEVPKPIPF